MALYGKCQTPIHIVLYGYKTFNAHTHRFVGAKRGRQFWCRFSKYWHVGMGI